MAQVAEYEHYKRIKLLGEGSFGKAYLVECVSDKTLCVIKQVDLSKMTEQEKKDTLTEAKILEALNHPNVVKFREVYKTKKGKLCIVMDYADGGDLTAKLKSQRGEYFKEAQIIDWFTQICLGLKHVHDRKILHRDLKCGNIFLTKTNMIKMGDFGIARVLSSTRENARTMVGTPYYLSPEIINGKPYSFKSDIWSLGVILYELCALRPPFDASSLSFLAMKIAKGQYSPLPSVFSKELKNLVATLLQVDPSKRPNTNNILAMPIVQARIKSFLSESIRIKEFSHTILHRQNFVKNNMALDNIKRVNNELPIPELLLKQQQQQKQQASSDPNHQKPPIPTKQVQQQPVSRENPSPNPLGKPPIKQDVSPIPSNRQTPLGNNNIPSSRPNLGLPEQNKANYHYMRNPSPSGGGSGDPYKGPKIVNVSRDEQPNRTPSVDKSKDRTPSGYPDQRRGESDERRNVNAGKVERSNWENKVEKKEVVVNKDAKPNNIEVKDLNKDRWRIQENVYTPQQGQVRDPYKKEERNAYYSPQVQERKVIEYKKPVERDILGGGGYADPGKKPADLKARENKVVPQKVEGNKWGVVDNRDREREREKEKEKEKEKYKQMVQEKQKRYEEEKAKRAKEEAEENKRKQIAEEERVQKEKERELKRKEMYDDIKNRKQQQPKKDDPKVEIFVGDKKHYESEPSHRHPEKKEGGGGRSNNNNNKKDVTPDSEKSTEKRRSDKPASKPFHKLWEKEDDYIKAVDERQKQKELERQREKEKEKQKEREREREKERQRQKEKEKEREREKEKAREQEKKKESKSTEEVKTENEYVSRDAALGRNGRRVWGKIEYKDPKDVVLAPEVEKFENEILEKDKKGEVLERKEIKELEDIEALLEQLENIMGEEESPEQENEEVSTQPNSQQQAGGTQEIDRDDEEEDDQANEADSKKENGNKKDEFVLDFGGQGDLKKRLESVIGPENFSKAYKIIQDLFEKNDNLDAIKRKYGEDQYASLFPFLSKHAIDNHLQLLFDYVILENLSLSQF